jgi:hypothetical protein
MTTLEDVRNYAAQYGVNIGKADYQAAATNAEQRLNDKKATMTDVSRVDKALAAMPKLMSAIDGYALVGFKLLQGLFSTVGIFVVLIAVVVVEIGRVKHGVEMFESSGAAAFQAAFVLVMLNLLLEFLIHYVESRAAWHIQKSYAFSLRIIWKRIMYVLGISENWTSIEKSPASGLRTFQMLLSIGILWLALMGSVGNMLRPELVWHRAIVDVFFHSQAGAFVVWANGLVVSVLLVFGSQRLTAYIAQKAAEQVKSESIFDANAYHEQAYAEELMARMKAKVSAKYMNNHNGNGKGHDESPLSLPMTYSNGSG